MIAIFGRYIIRTILALLNLVVLSVSSLYLILDTQRGSDWLLHRGLAAVSPEAEFNSYRGSLARGISLQGLPLPLEGADIRLEQLTSSWNLWGVLSGRLPIHTIHHKELTIRLNPSKTLTEPDNSVSPSPWPNLGLPISVALEDVSINQLHISQANDTGGESRQSIEQIKLSAVLGLLNSKIKT
jgi:autotransporter translocation and assembly factor TamB